MSDKRYYEYLYEHQHNHPYKQIIKRCNHQHCHLVNATLLIIFWFSVWSFLDYLFFYIFEIFKIKNNALKLLTFAVASVTTIAVAVIHNKGFEFIPQYGF